MKYISIYRYRYIHALKSTNALNWSVTVVLDLLIPLPISKIVKT